MFPVLFLFLFLFCFFSNLSVIKVDTIPPVIMDCPDNIKTEVQPGISGSIVHWGEPKVDDNSGEVQLLSKTHSSGSYFPVGTTTVSYFFRDDANNVAFCVFSVTCYSGI